MPDNAELLIEFNARIDSMLARLEIYPPGPQRDTFLSSLHHVRILAEQFFGASAMGTAEVAGRMS